MATAESILDNAVTVLRRGESLTMDSVAREAGLTKPGVVHHFSTKEGLVRAVVDHIAERWERDLTSRASEASTPIDRLRAYVDFALTGDFDQSDLVLFSDVRLRELLSEQWTVRLEPWFGDQIEGSPARRAAVRAARLIADGAWLNQALGIPVFDPDERRLVHNIALQLIEKENDND